MIINIENPKHAKAFVAIARELQSFDSFTEDETIKTLDYSFGLVVLLGDRPNAVELIYNWLGRQKRITSAIVIEKLAEWCLINTTVPQQQKIDMLTHPNLSPTIVGAMLWCWRVYSCPSEQMHSVWGREKLSSKYTLEPSHYVQVAEILKHCISVNINRGLIEASKRQQFTNTLANFFDWLSSYKTCSVVNSSIVSCCSENENVKSWLVSMYALNKMNSSAHHIVQILLPDVAATANMLTI